MTSSPFRTRGTWRFGPGIKTAFDRARDAVHDPVSRSKDIADEERRRIGSRQAPFNSRRKIEQPTRRRESFRDKPTRQRMPFIDRPTRRRDFEHTAIVQDPIDEIDFIRRSMPSAPLVKPRVNAVPMPAAPEVFVGMPTPDPSGTYIGYETDTGAPGTIPAGDPNAKIVAPGEQIVAADPGLFEQETFVDVASLQTNPLMKYGLLALGGFILFDSFKNFNKPPKRRLVKW